MQRKGTITIIEAKGATIHSYMSPEDSGLVNTQIIETNNALVLVDAQFVRPYAREVKAYAEGLGKPIDRILITHAHPDHWFGLEVFEGIPVYTLAEIRDEIEREGDTIIGHNKPALGELITDEAIVPTHSLEVGPAVIDGVKYEFSAVREAEGGLHLVIRLPQSSTLIAQDLLYNRVHLFVGEAEFDGWRRAVEELQRAGDHEVILAGHGEPATASIFAEVIEYIETARAAYSALGHGEGLKRRLIERYPEYRAPLLLDLSNRVLGETT